MIRPRHPGGKWAVLAWVVVPVALAGIFLARDRTTLERGNRLFRAGAPAEAVEVYRTVLGPDSALVELYNLGTALQRTGSELERDPAAEDAVATPSGATAATGMPPAVTYLETALALGDSLESTEGVESDGGLSSSGGTPSAVDLDPRSALALQRTHYNLGIHYLGRLDPSMRLDSAFLFASAAVTHNREALYRDPDDENARWNLALAQRSLDSLLVQLAVVDSRDMEDVEALEGIEFDGGVLSRAESSEPDALPPPEGTRPDPEERQTDDQAQDQAAIEGAREALEGQDPGLVDRARALETLRGFRDNPELVVRGILWVQRPDVVWWDQTPYPGGDW